MSGGLVVGDEGVDGGIEGRLSSSIEGCRSSAVGVAVVKQERSGWQSSRDVVRLRDGWRTSGGLALSAGTAFSGG